MKKELNPIDLEIGKKIKLKRLENGFSQGQLGQRVNLTFQQIQKYEKAYNSTRASKLVEIANALDVSVNYFFKGFDAKFGASGNIEVTYMSENNDNELYMAEIPTDEEIKRLLAQYTEISNTESRKNIMQIVGALSKAD